MQLLKRLTAVACLLPVLSLPAQQQAGKSPFYFKPDELHVELILRQPPSLGSPQDVTEFNEVMEMQQARSGDDVIRARHDDTEEDMFVFADVMGPGFTASRLPALAQLSARLKNDSEIVDPPLKHLFRRPRPYVRSAEVQPVCALSKEPSYPSGHAMLGYLFAYVLAEIVPEKHEAILQRADQYALNRLVCGVHYRSDVEASRLSSAVLYGAMLGNADYRHDVEAVRREWRMRRPSNLVP